MPSIHGIHRALTVFILGLLSPVVNSQEPTPGWTSVTDEQLRDPAAGDWMNYRRSYDATGYSPLDDINRRNVEFFK